jgi:hypothetical protein
MIVFYELQLVLLYYFHLLFNKLDGFSITKPAGSTKFQENLECLSNNVQLEDRCGIESLAEIVKTVASSRVSCDGSNN